MGFALLTFDAPIIPLFSLIFLNEVLFSYNSPKIYVQDLRIICQFAVEPILAGKVDSGLFGVANVRGNNCEMCGCIHPKLLEIKTKTISREYLNVVERSRAQK